MTSDQRRDAIKKMIVAHTEANTATKALARASLIREGVYDDKGRLTPEFGGKKHASK